VEFSNAEGSDAGTDDVAFDVDSAEVFPLSLSVLPEQPVSILAQMASAVINVIFLFIVISSSFIHRHHIGLFSSHFQY